MNSMTGNHVLDGRAVCTEPTIFTLILVGVYGVSYYRWTT